MKKTFILSAMAAASLLMVSCKKETPTPTNATTLGTCKEKSYTQISSNDTFLTSYEYNVSGKLSRENLYVNEVLFNYLLYDYATNGIINVKDFAANGTLSGLITYKLDSNGNAINKMYDNDTIRLYEYDSAGYMIKKIFKNNGQIDTYKITNGNVTQVTTGYLSDTTTYTTTFIYSDKPDKCGSVYSFLGKQNVNLASKAISGGNEYTISYIFNSNGYPLKIGNTTYTYTCQ